jgi:hypothetical protein
VATKNLLSYAAFMPMVKGQPFSQLTIDGIHPGIAIKIPDRNRPDNRKRTKNGQEERNKELAKIDLRRTA